MITDQVWIEVGDYNFEGLIGEFKQVGIFKDCRYNKKEKELLKIATARNENGENIWIISNLNSSKIIEICKLRMQIEETFRDIKDLQGFYEGYR